MPTPHHHSTPIGLAQTPSKHLIIQHSLYAQASQQFLLRAGLRPGMCVLEAGCAAGDMSLWLAQHVKTNGKVIAMDTQREQLDLAKARAANRNLQHLQFIEQDFLELKNLNHEFDFIYCRAFLQHFTQPELVVDTLLQCLKLNGTIVIEEHSIDSGFCYPYTPAYDQLFGLLKALFKAQKKDDQIAYKIPTLFHYAQMRHIKLNLFQPYLLSKKQRRLPHFLLEAIRSPLLHHHLTDAHSIDRLSIALDQAAETNADMAWPRLHQTAARKNKTSI